MESAWYQALCRAKPGDRIQFTVDLFGKKQTFRGILDTVCKDDEKTLLVVSKVTQKLMRNGKFVDWKTDLMMFDANYIYYLVANEKTTLDESGDRILDLDS